MISVYLQGVGDVVFREVQPNLSVVSNGAECLLVSKPFFRQHSTEGIINNLRRTVRRATQHVVFLTSRLVLQGVKFQSRRLVIHRTWAFVLIRPL